MRKIGEVSEITGVSRKTIRGYVDKGIIAPASLTEQGYQLFDDSVITTVIAANAFQEAGFTREEIKRLFNESSDDDFDVTKMLDAALERLEIRKQRIESGIKLFEFLKTAYSSDNSVLSRCKLSEILKMTEGKSLSGILENSIDFFDNPKYSAFMQGMSKIATLKNQDINAEAIQNEVDNMFRGFEEETLEQYKPEDDETKDIIKKAVRKVITNIIDDPKFKSYFDIMFGDGSTEFVLNALRRYGKNV